MAAEYSRDLSAKVFAGHCRLTELGFRQGGTAGYGLRRLLIDQDGKAKWVLQRGVYKNMATDRVVLIPGPSEEVEVVREIFHRYVEARGSAAGIATMLNERGVLARTVSGGLDKSFTESLLIPNTLVRTSLIVNPANSEVAV
jgi:hypothetical protein